MLWTHYKDMVKWRIHYFSRIRQEDVAHTVLLRDIPGTPQGTVVGRVYDVRITLFYSSADFAVYSTVH
jgi:hypothetical protein